MKDEPEAAELILHDALRLAYESDNRKAITYTYDLVTALTSLAVEEGWVLRKCSCCFIFLTVIMS